MSEASLMADREYKNDAMHDAQNTKEAKWHDKKYETQNSQADLSKGWQTQHSRKKTKDAICRKNTIQGLVLHVEFTCFTMCS